MQSRTASSIKLGVVLILVVLIAVFGLTGSLRIGKYRFFPFADFLDPGLDLGGGVSATYAAADASADGLEEQLSQAEAVLRARLTALELPEANVTRLGDGLRVETPASADAEGDLSAIGAVGRLECQDSSGNVVLEGAAMTSPAVSTVYDDEGNPYPAVDFHPSDEAAQALSALSASETLNVYLDGELIASVTPEQLSSNGVGFIPLTGYASAAEGARAAKRMAAILASGELPLELENTRLETITPLMGENAGTLVSVAALAALAAAIVGLIARYRLPGAAAALGVAVWALLTVVFLCELSFARMSLSGVAGVLAGLGLTAGGFALLLERCGRESRSYALSTALRRAWRSTLPVFADAGIALLLLGLAAYFLGAGAVKNFAAALLISVLCALAVLVLFSRFFLGNGLRLAGKAFTPKADLAETKPLASMRLRLIVPAALIAVALVMQLCGAGLRAGADIGSGAVLRYALGEEFALEDAAAAAREAGVNAEYVVKAEATTEEAAADEAAADETATDEAAADDAAADETAADETAADETAADETAADDAAADETAADETTTDETAADGTAADETAVDETAADDAAAGETAAGGMTDVEFRVSGADAASLEGAQEALLTALSARYAGARLVFAEDADSDSLPAAGFWALLAGCALAAIYLAIRFGVAGGVAALAACLLDALLAVALSAIFGWALPVENGFPAAIAFACACSLLAGAPVLNRYRETLRAPGSARLSAEKALAEDARAARGRALSVTAPLLLASLCMLALGPALVRAMALPMLSGALSALVSATGLTGRLWARLYRPGK